MSQCGTMSTLLTDHHRSTLSDKGPQAFSAGLSFLDGTRGRQTDILHTEGRYLEPRVPLCGNANRGAPLGQAEPDAGAVQGLHIGIPPMIAVLILAFVDRSSAKPVIPSDVSPEADDFMQNHSTWIICPALPPPSF